MRKWSVLCVGSVLLLTSCSLTLPVTGKIQSTSETFRGTATGYMDGGGVLTMTLESGVVCKGDFVYVTERTGEGVFNCDDGRSGPFKFVSAGNRGTGSGNLKGDIFTFTFGDFKNG